MNMLRIDFSYIIYVYMHPEITFYVCSLICIYIEIDVILHSKYLFCFLGEQKIEHN